MHWWRLWWLHNGVIAVPCLTKGASAPFVFWHGELGSGSVSQWRGIGAKLLFSRSRLRDKWSSEPPHPEPTLSSYQHEVPIGAQHREVVPQAQLGQQRVDRADLYAGSPATVPEVGGSDLIFAIGLQDWQGRESFDDLFP